MPDGVEGGSIIPLSDCADISLSKMTGVVFGIEITAG